jgi:hypothetical protein
MARPKKTTRKATPKKATAKKPRTSAKSAPKAQKGTPSTSRSNGTRRPANNPNMPPLIIGNLIDDLSAVKATLDEYAKHMRALDRMRLNGVGIKKEGFIMRAYELAMENGEFFPHYLTIEKFGTDIQYYTDFRILTDLTAQIREQLWNITIQSADIAYTDALEFYASVREAAKRRIDAAETLYAALSPFFKSHGRRTEEEGAPPTKKQALRDFKALESGKHDGILVIENQKPKLTGGKRKIIDETFKDTAEFKDTEQGEIKE